MVDLGTERLSDQLRSLQASIINSSIEAMGGILSEVTLHRRAGLRIPPSGWFAGWFIHDHLVSCFYYSFLHRDLREETDFVREMCSARRADHVMMAESVKAASDIFVMRFREKRMG